MPILNSFFTTCRWKMRYDPATHSAYRLGLLSTTV